MSIDQVATRLLGGGPTRIEPITAGQTNQNFRVEVDGTPYFVRLPGQSIAG